MTKLGKHVVYQVYPKSFQDSNGDGVGDLPGIIERLPYLAGLGVTMIWLNPIFPSPQNDNGYDISDYTAIDPLFGTMSDFEELVAEAKKYHMGIMLDMVFNHTSTAHAWFQKALEGDSKYQDYYYLRPYLEDGREPTNWVSKFGGSAWSKFGDTNLAYLHLYDPTQADLNWHNPSVRHELYNILNFWLAKGVRGFRFDVINVIGKAKVLVDDETDNGGKYLYTDTPIVKDYIQKMNAATFGNYPDVITVGELSSTTIKNTANYTNPANNALSMGFNFHHLKVDYEQGNKWTKVPYDFESLRHIWHEWSQGLMAEKGWPAWFWNNHDQPRAINRFVNSPKYYCVGAKMLAILVHLNRGTPYIYMGEEIGMLDPKYQSMADYVDVESKNAYQMLLNQGLKEQEAFGIVQTKSRDNSRVPMQWDNKKYAGFSTHQPWLRNSNYNVINVAQDKISADSLYAFYQKLIRLRQVNSIISDGDYTPKYETIPEIIAFERRLKHNRILVVTHFGEEPVQINLANDAIQTGQLLVSSYSDFKISREMTLRPYESFAIQY
ncbi:glucohydrolase [Leuconostoc litchii]|uniref:Alpha,alpha-phosphotrehalase n=1 Tax=Leuconostoc litchii TaxID=1981069 RepID=A0A6P2CPV2_9LACO|nr:alpha,alpha-phosphotrehalase [Leuconostoc litchii]TYC47413.1 alpha,alpha-phosphotrehalase [Leuconostoc litchii]GMA69428.1 glucohydrolase [Leuconostoc litchii]